MLDKFIISLIITIIIVSFYGLAEAKEPESIMWAKCIDEKDRLFDCKLVNEKIIVNGKVSKYKKVLVGEFYNTLVVLVKE